MDSVSIKGWKRLQSYSVDVSFFWLNICCRFDNSNFKLIFCVTIWDFGDFFLHFQKQFFLWYGFIFSLVMLFCALKQINITWWLLIGKNINFDTVHSKAFSLLLFIVLSSIINQSIIVINQSITKYYFSNILIPMMTFSTHTSLSFMSTKCLYFSL